MDISDSEGNEWVPPTTVGHESDDSLKCKSSDGTVVSDSYDDNDKSLSDQACDKTDKSDDDIPLATLKMRSVATVATNQHHQIQLL